MAKLKLKKGDTVKVIAENDKGSTGEILKVLVGENKVIIAGVNKVKKPRNLLQIHKEELLKVRHQFKSPT